MLARHEFRLTPPLEQTKRSTKMAAIRREYPGIAPAGPSYSRGVRSGNLLFISGCTARGTDAQGKPLMDQLRITLDRITRIAQVEGGASADIVKITTFPLRGVAKPSCTKLRFQGRHLG